MAPAKSKTKRNRSNFVSIHLMHSGPRDITALVDEARRRGREGKQRAKHDDRANAVAETALRRADNVTELFMNDLPDQVTASDIVKALYDTLYAIELIPVEYVFRVLDSSDPFPESPVLRCDIRPAIKGKSACAHVSVRNPSIAQRIVNESPIKILSDDIHVSLSNRPVLPGLGTAWRSRRDPGSYAWAVGMIQVGEKVSENRFRSFWTSSSFFDLSEDCHIELNPIERILALKMGHKQPVYMSKSFKRSFSKSDALFRIEVPFRSIIHLPQAETSPTSKQDCAVYIRISRPPLMFRGEHLTSRDDTPHESYDLTWDCNRDFSESLRWIRTIDPTICKAFSRARGVRVMLGSSDMHSLFEQLYRMCIADCVKPTPVPVTFEVEQKYPIRHNIFHRAAKLYRLPFPVRYMVECVVSLGKVSLSSLDSSFWEILASVSEEDALAALDLMYFRLSDDRPLSRADEDAILRNDTPVELLRQCMAICNVRVNQMKRSVGLDTMFTESIDEPGDGQDQNEEFLTEFLNDMNPEDSQSDGRPSPDSPTSILEDADVDSLPSRARIPSRHHALIRRLLFTPTRIIAYPPEMDLLNRVLREFSIHHDRFIRVSFCDEDGGSVAHTSSEDLFTRIRIALREGIPIAGEKFVFLAFSNSQLRDHAVWMYNETPDPLVDASPPPSAHQIRGWMGDFSKIRTPGKFAARQGQTFSSTVGTVLLDDVQQKVVEDIYNETMQYMFSDGVGLMSSELAKKVTEKLQIPITERTPSAFQVRFGGAKGMLTVWDSAFPKPVNRREKRVEVILRQSMKKFECSHKALEIVGYSKRLPLFLNRQIITLLSGHGVPDESFEELQRKLLRQLDRAMEADGAASALYILHTSGCLESGHKLVTNTANMNAAAFFRAGLTCTNCEHLFNMMYAFRRRTIRDLMLRARIPIDSEKGVCAIGVMDELGVLEPNEIFCQYAVPTTGKVKTVTGPVTVGRSPCLHPGDIQPLKAVDHPSLRDLVDVIVFPKKGKRPIPTMLSGGDLDGDIYFVLFDETLALPVKDGSAPMDYRAPKPIELPHPVRPSDVADFFVQYLRNDRLGVIANAHVVYSDKDEKSVWGDRCLLLAQLHSVAVDFAKTGVPADIPMDLLPRKQMSMYPDFMGKHSKLSYVSDKVLGKLYRACRACTSAQANNMSDYSFQPNSSSRNIDSIFENIVIEDAVMEDAKKMCHAYNVEMVRLMDQFGVRTEGEVVSGQVISFMERHAQLRGRREHFALQMRLNKLMNDLRAQFHEEFFSGLHETPQGEYSVETIVKACAWYKACRQQADADRRADNMVLVSFPWVVSDILLNIISAELKKEADKVADGGSPL